MSSATWTTAATLGRRNMLASAGMLLVAVFVVFALFAPWIAPQNPSNIDLPSRLQPPAQRTGSAQTNWAETFFRA